MFPGRVAIFAAATLACLAGGCKRGVLGEPGAGSLAGSGADAGGATADARAGNPNDGSPVPDAGVDPGADGSVGDGFSTGPITTAGCIAVPPPGPCPADRPAQGSPCPIEQTLCEYGGADVRCRELLFCGADLTWQLSRSLCADQPVATCPDAPPESGSACRSYTWCSYPEHTICVCVSDPRWACWTEAAA